MSDFDPLLQFNGTRPFSRLLCRDHQLDDIPIPARGSVNIKAKEPERHPESRPLAHIEALGFATPNPLIAKRVFPVIAVAKRDN